MRDGNMHWSKRGETGHTAVLAKEVVPATPNTLFT